MNGEKLEITKRLPAPAAQVFRAWTEPQMISEWFAPPPMTATVSQLDARPGGAFRIEMSDPSGPTYVVTGTFREVQNNARLVFSWRWEGSEGPETVVTVQLNPQGEKTELTLTHEGFPTAELRDQHVHGWSASTGQLEKLLAAA